MGKIELYGLVGIGAFLLLSGAHWTGRLAAAKNCEKRIAASAAEAIGEKNDDDGKQKEAATSTDMKLRAAIARLDEKLEALNVPTGLDCDAPGSGDVVHDAYDEVFEEGLQPGH